MFRDDSAISHGMYAVGVIILVAGVVGIVLTMPVLNHFISFFNYHITAGRISVDTANCFNWNVAIFSGLGAFIILAVFIWMIIKAVEEGGQGY